MGPSLAELQAGSPLSGSNASYVESLYERYLADPAGIDPAWRAYFDALPASSAREQPHTPIIEGIAARARLAPEPAATDAVGSEKQAAVSRLIQMYGNRGHLVAKIDPLGLMQRPRPRVLDLDYVGLSEADLDHEFYTSARTTWMAKRAPLREIIARLERVYCGPIGAEFAHVSDTDERLWLQDQFQLGRMEQQFNGEEKRNILWQLTAAEGLERYLHTRFVGQKRFSLEGGEALIAQLNDLVQEGGRTGLHEVIIGMAHRGRLNVLINVLGKAPSELFSEFEGKYELHGGSGDVKYN